MSRPQTSAEFRQSLAENFLKVLELKGLAWKQEWHSSHASAPYNGVSKVPYHGCNQFNLTMIAILKGYSDPRWVTMVQIMDKSSKYHPAEKWHLKKGSQATYVEFWYPFDTVKKKALTWDEYRNELDTGRPEEEFLLKTRYTAVFNATDVEGMSPLPEFNNPTVDIDKFVTTLSTVMNVPIINDGGSRAYYAPKSDKIHLPKPSSFESTYAYNATALHELAHATGHPSRLNRDMSGKYGQESYAFEELVAEISSCFMSINLGCELTKEHLENHQAYVSSWLTAIHEKPEALSKAISQASAVAVYMETKASYLVSVA